MRLSEPYFKFEMKLPPASVPYLLEGELRLIEKNVVKEKYVSTSGCARCQFINSDAMVGRGQIPACRSVNLTAYEVGTRRLWMPETKGIEGSAYQLYPVGVNVRGINRAGFMIHFDANAPGSAGCIVLRRQGEWDRFRAVMAAFEKAGKQRIDVIVAYT